MVGQESGRKRQLLWLLVCIFGAAVVVGVGAWFLHKRALGVEFQSQRLDRTDHGFYVAVKNGDLSAVKLFLADGFSPNARFGKWDTPILVVAAQANQLEICRALIQAGANVSAADSLGGHQAIHVAASLAKSRLVEMLLIAGSSPNARGFSEVEGGAFVPLYSVVLGAPSGSFRDTKERIDTIEILLRHGAQLDEYHPRFSDGPLHLAVLRGLDEIAKFLLEHGADIEHPDAKGDTPLMISALAGNAATVTLLISSGAQPNHRTQRGTALLLAANRGHVEVVRLLLKAGADPSLTDAAGKTAYDVAHSTEVVQVLRRGIGTRGQ